MKIFFFSILFLFSVPVSISYSQWQPEIRLTNDPAYSWTSNNNAWCVAANESIVHVIWFDLRDGGNSEIYYKRNFTRNVTGIKEIESEIPKEFSLSQNFPNPFNPSTKISWQSPVSNWQTIKVFDLLGREVVTLADKYKSAGRYEVEFDVAHESLRAIASGVYFYQLKAGSFVQTRKMLLIN